MRGREDTHLFFLADHITRERVDVVERVNLIAEELHTHRHLFVGGNDVHGVALDTEGAAFEVHVIALILHVYKQAQEAVALHLLAYLQHNRTIQVGLRRTQTVDAGDGGNHHNVTAAQQRRGGRVAQTLHVIINRRVFLNVGIRLRYVGLWLVVVVVRDEILHGVIG